MTDDRDPKVSYRMPQERLDAIDDLAEQFNVTRSDLLRKFDSLGLESNVEALGVEAEIAKLKDEIIEFGKPIDRAGGFGGRVRQDFERRFKNNYKPKWLAAKAESYRREARMLEKKVSDHPDAPPIEDGELVEEVEDVLRDTLEAAKLSDWTDQYNNPYERLSGVESGKDSRRFALVLARNALQMDSDLEPLNSELDADRRVQARDLPELAEEDLPEHVSRDDVARVARTLADRGVAPEEIETDPTEFDPFGWGDDAPAVDAVEQLPDGGPKAITADGGDHAAVQSFSNESTPAASGETTDETNDMDHSEPLTDDDSTDDLSTRDDLLDYATEQFEDMGTDTVIVSMVRDTLKFGNSEVDYSRAVEKRGIDIEAVIEEARTAAEDTADGTTEGTADA